MTAPTKEKGPAGGQTVRTHCYAKTATLIVRRSTAKECHA